MKISRIDISDVIIRDFSHDDIDMYQEGFRRLSNKSLRARFNCAIKQLTPSQLKYLTEIDYTNHYACGAHVTIDGRIHGLGLARFVRLNEKSDVAEYALTVIDDYQRQGVGNMLFAYLIEKARERGIRILRGYIQSDNEPMLSMVRKLVHCMKHEGGNLLRVDIDITPKAL
jgi:acetyltransferase